MLEHEAQDGDRLQVAISKNIRPSKLFLFQCF